MRFTASLIAVVCTLAVAAALPAVASAASGSPRLDRAERSLLRAINIQRAANGLHRLRIAKKLNRAADYHSREMLYGNYFAHPSLNGSPMENRVRRFKRSRRVGETLAMLSGRCKRGMVAPVINMWMNSPSHRAIMLSPGFRKVGVARRGGSLNGNRACMVTADYASRR
jgi:uncharacterized protein YkwD